MLFRSVICNSIIGLCEVLKFSILSDQDRDTVEQIYDLGVRMVNGSQDAQRLLELIKCEVHPVICGCDLKTLLETAETVFENSQLTLTTNFEDNCAVNIQTDRVMFIYLVECIADVMGINAVDDKINISVSNDNLPKDMAACFEFSCRTDNKEDIQNVSVGTINKRSINEALTGSSMKFALAEQLSRTLKCKMKIEFENDVFSIVISVPVKLEMDIKKTNEISVDIFHEILESNINS